MTEILKVSNLVKKYKSKSATELIAVNDISFSVNSGEIVGFLGPNGAGKSTTIKMIAGLATPTKGDIFINGYSVKKERIKAMSSVGGVIESPDLYLNMSAYENLKYFASLHPKSSMIDISNPEQNALSKKVIDKNRIADVLSIVGLTDRQKDAVKKYSLGMKQRLGIAQALLCKPKLLILDEPANGLDPQGIKDIRNMLKNLASKYDMAILVSSHQLAEMQLMCDRVLIIADGKITAERSLNELAIDAEGLNLVRIKVDKLDEACAYLTSLNCGSCEVDGDNIKLHTNKPISEISKSLIMNGFNLFGITAEAVQLEDVFINATQKEKK